MWNTAVYQEGNSIPAVSKQGFLPHYKTDGFIVFTVLSLLCNIFKDIPLFPKGGHYEKNI